jgi:ADP-ribose pyrophosphatase YjhB (NUDIX family)
MNYDWLNLARKIQSIAQAGLTYSENAFDLNRYEQLQQIAAEILQHFTGVDMDTLTDLIETDKGYPTPKVDVRGVVFRDEQILLVKERIDGRWSVPGGWADVGLTPFEVAEKEVWEESGLRVKAYRLLAVLDKMRHSHPPDFYHIYKLFIMCIEAGGKLSNSLETTEARFFRLDKLPELSETRITREQIEMLFDFYKNPEKQSICD